MSGRGREGIDLNPQKREERPFHGAFAAYAAIVWLYVPLIIKERGPHSTGDA